MFISRLPSPVKQTTVRSGLGQGRADGRRQPETHGAEPAGGEPLPGPAERVGLGRPHLVLADVGGDDGASLSQAATARMTSP